MLILLSFLYHLFALVWGNVLFSVKVYISLQNGTLITYIVLLVQFLGMSCFQNVKGNGKRLIAKL